MNLRTRMWIVWRFFCLAAHPVLLWSYIDAGATMQPRMFRREVTDIQHDFRGELARILDDLDREIEKGRYSKTFEKAFELFRHISSHEVVTEDPRTIARQQLETLYWLHPERMYNELIDYDPHNPQITDTTSHDPVDVARTTLYLRRIGYEITESG